MPNVVARTNSSRRNKAPNSPTTSNNIVVIESIIETVSIAAVSILALRSEVVEVHQDEVVDTVSIVLDELIQKNKDDIIVVLYDDAYGKEIINVARKLVVSGDQVFTYTGSTTEAIDAACSCIRVTNGLFGCTTVKNNNIVSTNALPDLCESSESTRSKTNNDKKEIKKITNPHNTTRQIVYNAMIAIHILLKEEFISKDIAESIAFLMLSYAHEKEYKSMKRRNTSEKKSSRTIEAQVIVSAAKVMLSSMELGIPDTSTIELMITLLSQENCNHLKLVNTTSTNVMEYDDVSYISTDSPTSSRSTTSWYSSSLCEDSLFSNETTTTTQGGNDRGMTTMADDNSTILSEEDVDTAVMSVTKKKEYVFNSVHCNDGIQLLSVCESFDIIYSDVEGDDASCFSIVSPTNTINTKNKDNVMRRREMPVSIKLVRYFIDLYDTYLDCSKEKHNGGTTTSNTSAANILLDSHVSDDTPIVRNSSSTHNTNINIVVLEEDDDLKRDDLNETSSTQLLQYEDTTTTTTTSRKENQATTNTIKTRKRMHRSRKAAATATHPESIEALLNTYQNETMLLFKSSPSSPPPDEDRAKHDSTTIQNDKSAAATPTPQTNHPNSNIEVIMDGINQIFVLAKSDAVLVSTNNESKKKKLYFKPAKIAARMIPTYFGQKIFHSNSFQSTTSTNRLNRIQPPLHNQSSSLEKNHSHQTSTSKERRKKKSAMIMRSSSTDSCTSNTTNHKQPLHERENATNTNAKDKENTKLLIVEYSGKVDIEVIQVMKEPICSTPTNMNNSMFPIKKSKNKPIERRGSDARSLPSI